MVIAFPAHESSQEIAAGTRPDKTEQNAGTGREECVLGHRGIEEKDLGSRFILPA